jgi:hypothetical protein
VSAPDLRPATGGLPCALGFAQPLSLPGKRARAQRGLRSPALPIRRAEAKRSPGVGHSRAVQARCGTRWVTSCPLASSFISTRYSLTSLLSTSVSTYQYRLSQHQPVTKQFTPQASYIPWRQALTNILHSSSAYHLVHTISTIETRRRKS